MARDLRPGEKPRALDPELAKQLDKKTVEYLESLEFDNGLPVADLPYDDDPRLREMIAKRNDAIQRIEEIANPIPEFVGEPVQIRYPVGQPPIEIDAMGHTREVPGFDPEELEQHRATEERFAQDLADLALAWEDVRRHQEVAASVPDSDVRRVYSDRAHELAQQAAAKRDFLREERIKYYEAQGETHEDAVDLVYDGDMPTRLGETKPVVDSKVDAALAAIQAHQFDSTMVEGMTPRERYLLVQEAGRIDPELVDAITDQIEKEYSDAT